jgi:hypothetical protein
VCVCVREVLVLVCVCVREREVLVHVCLTVCVCVYVDICVYVCVNMSNIYVSWYWHARLSRWLVHSRMCSL